MDASMDWERDSEQWPHRDASRFVEAGGMDWHVQKFGTGPPLLLVHGTGASSHSWRDLVAPLERHFTLVIPDLPGHGFTAMAPPSRRSLPGMAALLGQLLNRLGLNGPLFSAGHSAGAAVLLRLALSQPGRLRSIVSMNGALVPFAGLQRLLAPAARLLAAAPLVPRLVAAHARDRASVERLIAGTGSRLDAEGADLYARLMRDPAHVAGALAMMANWDLDSLYADLPWVELPLLLLAGARDRTVSPEQASVVAARVRDARMLVLPGLGHLAHEEAPAEVAALILQHSRRAIVPGSRATGGERICAEPA